MTAPSAPLAPYAIGFNGGAVVYWNYPADDGGTLVASYTVTASPDGGSFVVQAMLPTRLVFSGLTNGAAYVFAITATNGDGTSATATTPMVVPPGLPGSLPQMFLQLQAQLAADYAARALPVPESQFGGEYKAENSSFDRLVMTVEIERPGPVTTQGAGPGGPRQVGNRITQLAFECWGGCPAPTQPDPWKPLAAYSIGQQVLGSAGNYGAPGRWQCVTGGTSGAETPFSDNPAYGQTQSDASPLTWICVGSNAQDARNQYGATEALFNFLWTSLWKLYGGGKLKWAGTAWLKVNGEMLAYGSVATFRVTLELPLYDDWGQFAKLTGLPATYTFAT